MSGELAPGPWEITFVSNVGPNVGFGIRAGYYATRKLPGSKAPNAREWMQRGDKPRRFASVEDANAAIAWRMKREGKGK